MFKIFKKLVVSHCPKLLIPPKRVGWLSLAESENFARDKGLRRFYETLYEIFHLLSKMYEFFIKFWYPLSYPIIPQIVSSERHLLPDSGKGVLLEWKFREKIGTLRKTNVKIKPSKERNQLQNSLLSQIIRVLKHSLKSPKIPQILMNLEYFISFPNLTIFQGLGKF